MDLAQRAERIRRARERHGTAGRGNPYPAWMRREALAYVDARSSEGACADQISRELGLPTITLQRWARRPLAGQLVPVIVEAPSAPSAGALVVHGPYGLRIEGLEVSSLASLLRALS